MILGRQAFILGDTFDHVVWGYRGGVLLCDMEHCYLELNGHPWNGMDCRTQQVGILVIDWWQDLTQLPPGVVLPPPIG